MVGSYELEEAGFGKVFKFPAPIEVWMVSYLFTLFFVAIIPMFPAPIEG